jgi:hypothetical protein
MNQISGSQNRFTLFTLPNLRPILKAYQQKLKDHRASFYLDSIPYGFDAFNNGIKISPWMKVFYKELVHDASSTQLPRPVRESYKELSHQNPFCTSELEDDCGRNETSSVFFLDWILAGPYRASPLVDLEGQRYFSELEQRIWESRPDLQNHFPDPHVANYDGFKDWFQNHPVNEGLLDEKLYQRWKGTFDVQRSKEQPPIVLPHAVNFFGWRFSYPIAARVDKLPLSSDAAVAWVRKRTSFRLIV